MSHKIAILSIRNVEYNYNYDDYGDILIANSITDWEEVSDEDFKLLKSAETRSGTFRVIEQIIDQETFIAKTIEDYRRFARSEADKAAAQQRKREEEALNRKYKKELKDKVSKEKMLVKLAAELGVEVLPNK